MSDPIGVTSVANTAIQDLQAWLPSAVSLLTINTLSAVFCCAHCDIQRSFVVLLLLA